MFTFFAPSVLPNYFESLGDFRSEMVRAIAPAPFRALRAVDSAAAPFPETVDGEDTALENEPAAVADTVLDAPAAVPDPIPAPVPVPAARPVDSDTRFAIDVDARRLESAVKLVSRAALKSSSRYGEPEKRKALQSICLRGSEDGTLAITSTDLEQRFTVIVPGTVAPDSESRALEMVEPKALAAALKGAKGTVRVEFGALGSDDLIISGAGRRVAIPQSAQHDSFPLPPDILDSVDEFEMESWELVGRIESVSYAADKTEATARWAVTGVLFAFPADGGAPALVATDTRRLAWAGGIVKGGRDYLVPVPILSALVLAKLPPMARVRVRFGKEFVAILADGIFLYSKLVEGRFPPYAEIIPRTKAISATFNATLLAESVRAAALACDGTARVEFDFTDGAVRLVDKAVRLVGRGESSESRSDCPLVGYSGDPLACAFNPAFVVQMLGTFKKNELVTMEAIDRNRPFVFRGASSLASHLLMPLTGD